MPCLSVTAWRVYPRGCGGTNVKRTVGRYASGLSPRVRGNRGSVQLDGSATGSIPAGAGEPAPMRSGSAIQRVYPRGCGGTHSAGIPLNVVQGLSPRVRGNLCLGEVQHAVARSIPAGAGEPDDEARAPCFRGVYPRGCGGTVVVSKVTPVTRGLSPRVRGNLMIEALAFDQQRSIPAGAGEPIWCASVAPRTLFLGVKTLRLSTKVVKPQNECPCDRRSGYGCRPSGPACRALPARYTLLQSPPS